MSGLQGKAWCFRMFSVRKEGFELAPAFCKIQCTMLPVFVQLSYDKDMSKN